MPRCSALNIFLRGQRADVEVKSFVDLIERAFTGDLAPPAKTGRPIPPMVKCKATRPGFYFGRWHVGAVLVVPRGPSV